jgi:type I site-specific restriction endonuclease
MVQCLIRRKLLVLTPEEWVRQHLISFLNLSKGFSLEKISVEKQIQYDGFTKRWDIVVYDTDFKPLLLIECKAPSVPISRAVMEQISVYQRKIQAPFLALSNGLTHQVFALNEQAAELQVLNDFPSAN